MLRILCILGIVVILVVGLVGTLVTGTRSALRDFNVAVEAYQNMEQAVPVDEEVMWLYCGDCSHLYFVITRKTGLKRVRYLDSQGDLQEVTTGQTDWIKWRVKFDAYVRYKQTGKLIHSSPSAAHRTRGPDG